MSFSSPDREALLSRIYNINGQSFSSVAIDLWRFQFENNSLYREYCTLLGIRVNDVETFEQIPFFPVSFFRHHKVQTGSWSPERIFRSSGTSGAFMSQHLIRSLSWYHHFAERSFHLYFGDPASYRWIALLPTYLERRDSSLVDMVNHFMQMNTDAGQDFYKSIQPELLDILSECAALNHKTILIGVSFALLDLFESYNVPVWDGLMVIETGGMKGRRAEITRAELHERIRQNHPDLRIGSEYGMTELLSQAYSFEGGFLPGPAMKISIRDITDPVQLLAQNERGAINITDLANIDTCAFLATDDVGILLPDGTFDVLGRLDESDIRGCNLMYT